MSERTTTYFLEILQFRIAIVFGPDLTSKLAALNSKTLMIDVWLVKTDPLFSVLWFLQKEL